MKKRIHWGVGFLAILCMITGLFAGGSQMFSQHLNANTNTAGVGVLEIVADADVAGGSWASGKIYALGTDHTVYQGKYNSPLKPVYDENGNMLTNIKHIYTGVHSYSTTKPAFMAQTMDNSMYAWGVNTSGRLGNGTTTDIEKPRLIDEFLPTKDIVDIKIVNAQTFLLTSNGDVWAVGDNAKGNLATGDTTSTTRFVKTQLSNIKQLSIARNGNALSGMALGHNGVVYTWGSDAVTQGSGTFSTPLPLKADAAGTLFDVKIKSLVDNEGTYGGSYGFHLLDENNTLYKVGKTNAVFNLTRYDYDKDNRYETNTYPVLNSVISIPTGATVSDFRDTHMNLTVIIDGKIYAKSEDTNYGNRLLRSFGSGKGFAEIALTYFDEGDEPIYAHGTTPYTYIVTKNHKGYIHSGANGPVEISLLPPVKLTATKTKDNTSYASGELYHDAIRITATKDDTSYKGYELAYKVCDLNGENCGEETIVSGNTYEETITPEEGTVLQKTYKFYIKGKESESSQEFKVDLYKHTFDRTKMTIAKDGKYALNHKITWDKTNGLEGNTTQATLTDSKSNKKTYSYNSPIATEDTYTFDVKDDYGNSDSISFSVADIPTPTSIKLTSTESLVYKNDLTSKGATLGELSLGYPSGKPTSTVKTIEISEGNDDGYFAVSVDEATKKASLIANVDIPAGTYHLKFTGTDGNSMGYTNLELEVTIGKAANPITWNANTKKIITNGLTYGTAFTLGVDNKPDEMNVTYKMTSTTPNVTVDSDGKISVSEMNTNEITIQVETVATDAKNYLLTPLKGTIKIKKQSLSLKTVIGDDKLDTTSIALSDAIPSFSITSTTTLPTGIELPKPTGYSYYDTSTQSKVTAITKAGTYEIRPEFAEGALSNYTVTWGYARLTVTNVVINAGNASDYYSLLLDDGYNTPYTPGTWTKYDILVKPNHAVFSKIGIDGESPTTGTKTYSTENNGTTEMNLVFENSAGAKISTKVTGIKLDQTKPVLPASGAITYKEKSGSLFALLSFDQLFAKEQTATFHGTDALSGVSTYHYVVNEVNDKKEFLSEVASGDGTSVDLAVNKNYELKVTAIDNAGNISGEHKEYIKIDNTVPELKAEATITGSSTKYDGSWTKDGVTITLSCSDALTSYEYSTDGTTFTTMNGSTLNIANTANVNDVMYIFRGTTATGVQTTANVSVKIDKDTPVIELDAQSNGSAVTSGTITDHDVVFTLSNKTNNISGTEYYYTTDSAVSSLDPSDANSGWILLKGALTVSDNGENTYYFKALSNAGKSSAVTSFDVDMQKKDYTKPVVAATVKGTSYNGGWTNQVVDIAITGGLSDMSLLKGYEYCVTDGIAPSASDSWLPVGKVGDDYMLNVSSEQKAKSYWFRVDENGIVSDPVVVNIDKTDPIMNGITYTDQQQSAVRSLLNAVTFDQFFKDAQIATFDGSDTLSEVKEYKYTLSVIDDEGTVLSAGTQKTGTSVNLAKDTNFKLEVVAVDNAGNESSVFVQNIKINEKIGSFDITATTSVSNVPYSGQWVSEPIHLQLSSEDDIVEYAWSSDNVNFTPLTTDEYEITNTQNRNNEVMYFRATNAKNETFVESITANIDIDTPEVSIKAVSNGEEITTGEVATNDITFTFSNLTNNISNETYYYTNDDSVAITDPLADNSAWKELKTNVLTLTSNEKATYYVVAVSGAKLASSVASFDVVLEKKAYTKPVVKAMSDGKLYLNGAWTKENIDVEITGGIADTSLISKYEYTTTTSMSEQPSATSNWTTINAVDHKGTLTISDETASTVYWFRIPNSTVLSSPLEIKLDRTAPVVEEIKLTYKNADGLSQFLNMITFGAWFNQEIDAEVITSDNLNTQAMMNVEVQEVKNGVAGPWVKYTSTLHYGDGTNLILNARVSDQAGNVSAPKDGVQMLLDLTGPTIHGVEDDATYHVMRYITFEDNTSDINAAETYYEDGAGEHTLSSPAKFNGVGDVLLHVEDHAGNSTELSFTIAPRPNLDDLTDSDEDRELISGIVDEYEEVKEHMSEQERIEFEEWLENAKAQVKRFVNEVKEPDTNIIVSGLEDIKFDEEVALVVEIVTSELQVSEIKLEHVEGLDDKTELKEAYDIYLKKGDEIIQVPEDGSVKVLIPYTKERQLIKNLRVVYISKDNQVTIYPHEIETVDGEEYISFVTTHFSHYALVGDVEEEDLNKDTDGDGEPDINITEPGKDRPYLNIDTDKDNRPDVNVDLNGDKEADINIDTTGDFKPDVDIDSDGDGKPEINLDVNGDGEADKNIVAIDRWEPNFDVDEPIKYDTMKGIVYKDASDSIDKVTNDNNDNQGSQSGSNEYDPTVQGNYTQTGQNTGGANTGDAQVKTSILWLFTIVSGGVSIAMMRKKKKHTQR